MTHYEERLEQDLLRIREHVEELAETVEQALQNANEALLVGDESAAYMTVLGDNAINRSSRTLDRLCHAFIARHLPSAGHLRLMSAVIRVNVALERIGDYAVTISRESARLSRPPGGAIAQHLSSVAAESQSLLKQSVDAFNEGNSEIARELMPQAARVESIMDGVYDELIEDGNKREPGELVAVFVVFNLLKRISDQAKNICDQTVFAVDGEVKPKTIFKILFIDDDNACYSQIAEAVARKRYINSARFDSAGKDPAASINSHVLEFLDGRGIASEATSIQSVDALELDISNFNIVVALRRNFRELLSEMPFHTSALSWDLPELPPDSTAVTAMEAIEDIYRELVEKIDHLMMMLVGEDAD